MVVTISFFLYSLIGLIITYVLKISNFVKLTAVCRQEDIGVDNFMYNSSDRVLTQADKMLKFADMFEGFKILTRVSIIIMILNTIGLLLLA